MSDRVRVVHKFKIRPEETIDEIELPDRAEVLHVGEQDFQLTLWIKLDPNARIVPRRFHVYGTGETMADIPLKYLGSTPMHNGRVWHVFEET